MRVIVEVCEGPNTGQRFEVGPGEVCQVGRASWAEFSLPADRSLAGLHFAVECAPDGCRVRALHRSEPTLLNGGVIREAVLRDGDRIRAGDNTFRVAFREAAAPPAPADPAVLEGAPPTIRGLPRPVPTNKVQVEPAPAAAGRSALPQARQELVELLRRAQPLYAVLDAARSPAVLKRLRPSGEVQQSLFEGDRAKLLADYAPYLVRLPPTCKLLETLVVDGWGEAWGVYLTSTVPFGQVRHHLRRLLKVETVAGKKAYFRFYDPRILRAFLPVCTADEVRQFFGPIGTYWVEDRLPEMLLTFTPGEKGAEQKYIVLGLGRAEQLAGVKK